jgi:UDP-N-acetylglucosamine 2-epimerase (non-hydrolysing)
MHCSLHLLEADQFMKVAPPGDSSIHSPSQPKRVGVIYGTRPEAIKVAPLIRALEGSRKLSPVIMVTGQHREMLDQVNRYFGIVPEVDLNIMHPGASLGELASRALSTAVEIVPVQGLDALVVQGDTTSALMAALAGYYSGVPIVHVEAGLRTGDLSSPFPEEGNRRLISAIATLHLAPTLGARRNLEKEGISGIDIVVTGNTVIDALHMALRNRRPVGNEALKGLIDGGRRFVLITAHRRESWGAPLRNAMLGIRYAARKHADVHFLVAMHRNPTVRKTIRGILGAESNCVRTDPLDYPDFAQALQFCAVVVTDSGGVQEEAPSLGKPVLVIRETTERPEGIAAGTVRLVGTRSEDVAEHLLLLLDSESEYQSMANAVNPYGDGRAAIRSLAAIEEELSVGTRLADFSVPSD